MTANKKLYQWAGIDLGQYSTLLLQKSLKELAVKADASNLRLWGKIKGTLKDYFVVEGTSAQGAGEAEEGSIIEARGSEGVNKFAYWVSNSPAGPWTVLPDITAEDLRAAKMIKVLFSGDLSRKIVTNPFYFKSEKEYLRSTIARITFSTTLVPKGVYRQVEDNPNDIEENVPDEGPIPVPPTNEMVKA
jgi:radial spoke head protein 4A